MQPQSGALRSPFNNAGNVGDDDLRAAYDDEGGELPVDITFTSMDDFTPAKIAEKVEPLNELLEARNALKSLLTFMDGKQNAEKLIEDLLKNPELMKSLGQSGDKPAEEE